MLPKTVLVIGHLSRFITRINDWLVLAWLKLTSFTYDWLFDVLLRMDLTSVTVGLSNVSVSSCAGSFMMI